jgi:prevent-host-death family protein
MALAQYNTHDARNVFSHLLGRVRRGEQIVIAHAGRPIAKLVPYDGEAETRPGFLRLHLLVNDGLEEPIQGSTPTRSSPEASTSRREPLD